MDKVEITWRLKHHPAASPVLMVYRKQRGQVAGRSLAMVEAVAIYSHGEYPESLGELITRDEFPHVDQGLTLAIEEWLSHLGAEV